MATISKQAYAEIYGPTVGDRVRLADTGLVIEVEADHTLKAGGYGEEVNGRFYRSENSGQSFARTASMLSEAHYLYGSCILPSAIQDNVVYLSGNGYNFKPVYRSEDGGKTFKDMSLGLPKTMVFKLAANEDESLIFAATEAGPYVYVAEKKKWFTLSGAITPNQTYWSVEYIAATQTARFGTYGRGIWDFDVKVSYHQQNKMCRLFQYPNCTLILLLISWFWM